MSLFNWLETTAFAEWVQMSLYAYPLILAFHGIGMAFLVGTLMMFNLRLLGFARGLNVSEFAKLMKIAAIGLLLNLLTGLALFSANASRFVTNPPFLIKLGAIVIGLVISWVLIKKKVPSSNTWPDGAAPLDTKILAACSLVFWLTAIVAGRLIAYI